MPPATSVVTVPASTEETESSNLHPIYTVLLYITFQLLVPALLTAVNVLGSLAPRDKNSIGRVPWQYAGWHGNGNTDSEILSIAWKASLSGLLPAAFLMLLLSHCCMNHISEREEERLSEHTQSTLRLGRRAHLIGQFTHGLAGINLGVMLLGSFLFAFFNNRKAFTDASYIAVVTTTGTATITAGLYLIFGLGQCFFRSCCVSNRPVAQIPSETQTHEMQVQAATADTNPENPPPVIVVQQHSAPSLPAHGHQRQLSDGTRTAVVEQVLRMTRNGDREAHTHAEAEYGGERWAYHRREQVRHHGNPPRLSEHPSTLLPGTVTPVQPQANAATGRRGQRFQRTESIIEFDDDTAATGTGNVLNNPTPSP